MGNCYFWAMRWYAPDVFHVYEFDRLLGLLEPHTLSRGSRQMAVGLKPLPREEAMVALSQTGEYLDLLQSGSAFPDFLFDDFQDEAQLLAIEGSVLQAPQWLKIHQASTISNRLIRFLGDRAETLPHLSVLLNRVYHTDALIRSIEGVVHDDGTVKSSASAELGRIRGSLSQKRKALERSFRNMVQELKKLGWLRDNEETFYNGRRVLALLAERRKEVPGVVHGSSETGKTLFVEPGQTVELNNEIAALEQEEEREIWRILRDLTEQLRPFAPLVQAYDHFLNGLDFIRAKAMLAKDMDACVPLIPVEPAVRLREAVHPLLYLQNKSAGKTTVPMSLELDSARRLLLISGPNAGGKSITLKTVALFQLMLHSGLAVPCKPGSEMSLFNHFLSDVGDSQSIEHELSTYSSRLEYMKTFLKVANRRSLVFIDEFGTGTDPELGGALAEVILEELARKQAMGIITTHYTNLKLLADKLEGVINASMLFNPETLLPLYQLVVGQPGSSYTFEVAEKIGLPPALIKKARERVSKEKRVFNQLLSDLQAEKTRLIEETRKAQEAQEGAEVAQRMFEETDAKLKLRMERERERQEAQARIHDLGRKFQVLTEEWQQTKNKKDVIQKFVSNVTAEKKRMKQEQEEHRRNNTREKVIERVLKTIQPGSRVRILGSRETGVVEEVVRQKARVRWGAFMSVVGLENLEVIHDA